MEGVHRLASKTFQHMLTSVQSKPAEVPVFTHGGNDDLDDQLVDDEEGLVDAVSANIQDPSADPSTQDMALLNSKRKQTALSWLLSKPMPYMILIRLLLEPLVALMGAYIGRSGEKFALRQRAKAAQVALGVLPEHEYKFTSSMLEHAFLTAESVYFGHLAKLREAHAWQVFPIEVCTHKFQSLAFRLLSKMGCLATATVVQEAKRFPTKLFGLLRKDEELATEVLTMSACMLDPFTVKFKSLFEDRGLLHQDALACLELMALVSSPDTTDVEWFHGRVHRLLTKTTQTHKPSMHYVASQAVCHKLRLRYGSHAGIPLVGFKNVKYYMNKDEKKKIQAQAGQKRKRGGGGTWRAFTSKLARGAGKGRPSWQVLSTSFHEAKDSHNAAFVEAVAVGQVATARHKEFGVPSFGGKTRDILRKKRREALAHAPPHAGIDSVSASSVKVSSAFGQEVSLALHLDLAQELKLVRSHKRDEAKAAATKTWAEWEDLTKFREEVATEQLARVMDHLPAQVACNVDFKPVPHVSFTCMEMLFENVSLAEKLCGWAVEHSRNSNIKKALELSWQRRLQTVGHCGSANGNSEKSGQIITSCRKHNFCVCSSSGKEVLAFRNEVLRVLKEAYPKKFAGPREKLMNGHVCLRFSPVETVTPAHRELLEWMGHGDQEIAEVWYHLGSIKFKPYVPTYQVLQCLKTEGNKCLVEQVGEYFCDLEAIEKLSRYVSWQLDWYEVVGTDAPLDALNPVQIWVQKSELSTSQVWPKPLKPRGRRQAK
eukprot:4596777-Amphidinium_carterae.1